MTETKLNIELLDVTKNALALIYAACRQCYSSEFAADIARDKKNNKEKIEFIKKVVASGHESPLEHVKFTFAIEGVSRALTHQLVRHRLASFSQQSQRYVKGNNFKYIIPPLIKKDKHLKDEFLNIMLEIQKSYNNILEVFKEKGISGEKANQDARFVLPQATETKIVVTMNARELIHFFSQRCCARAQWEIKNLADKMLSICRKELPAVFFNSGAKCESLGFCPEGKKFTCGKYPLKEEILISKKVSKGKR